ncbi:hypothetical protein [Streptosporangium sp. CA-115845]|uniref:hypothetical protein n=1 Tax=Streptosporangium sp. CA-115845 TaxID=3240071 RepID=UPI003D8E74A6
MAVPTMTPQQRAKALEKAAQARTARSALLAAMKSGTTSVSGVVEKRRVGGLTRQQRERLLQALAG